MTDDDTRDQEPAGTARRDDAPPDPEPPTTTPRGDDGTTLTGESKDPGDASRRDLVEPSGQ